LEDAFPLFLDPELLENILPSGSHVGALRNHLTFSMFILIVRILDQRQGLLLMHHILLDRVLVYGMDLPVSGLVLLLLLFHQQLFTYVDNIEAWLGLRLVDLFMHRIVTPSARVLMIEVLT